MAKQYDDIDIVFTNDKELMKLFKELVPAVQNKIVMAGMRKAAQVIKSEATSSFKSVKKNKSKTGYKDFNKAFKIENMKRAIGVKVGLTTLGYKYRWIEWGTKEREYIQKKSKAIHKTGAVEEKNWFYSAVKRKEQEAANGVNNAILESLKKTVDKYNK